MTTPSPAPQQWADQAADEIYTLHVEEGLAGQCDFMAAIITKHAAAISEENTELKRRIEEQHKLYCEETKRHNETWAKIHAATGYLNKEFKKLPEDLLEAVKEVVFRVTLVELGRNSLQGEVSDLRAQLAAMDRTLRATAGEEYAHCTDAVGAVQEYVKDLEAERDSLQTQLDDNSSLGIHSCHDNCQRVECVLRRDRDRYRAACEEMRFERELAELRASGSEADKKRLDWLGSASQNQWIGLGLVRPIRAAIDAAMQQQEAKQ